MNKLDTAMAQLEDRPRDYEPPVTHFLPYRRAAMAAIVLIPRGAKQVHIHAPVCDFYFEANHAECSGLVHRCTVCRENDCCEAHSHDCDSGVMCAACFVAATHSLYQDYDMSQVLIEALMAAEEAGMIDGGVWW